MPEPATNIENNPTSSIDYVQVPPLTTEPEPANTFVPELEPDATSVLRPKPITRYILESALWNQSTKEPEEHWFCCGLPGIQLFP